MPLFKKDQPATQRNHEPLVIAHRGASGLAPENTLAAFKIAIALGADGIEMDVQLSADNRVIVMHDARVNRTTNATGNIADFTTDQLVRLDAGAWFDRRLALRPRVRAMAERASNSARGNGLRFSGEPVPTLEAALALLAPAGLRRIYIELKGDQKAQQPLLEATVALVRGFHIEQSATLLSFDHKIVKQVKQYAPDIRTAATFSIAGRGSANARSIIDSAARADADEVALHYGLATRRAVEALHESGLAVSVWTANSKLVMRRLAACGVDSIMTNFPNRLIGVLQSEARGK
ncbi:MAG TPA: glycerophosphodiester phosphodiesterase family protein [Blastocatellia bacterium]|nr:glycerophosphodiester phosphodiesterase family protein [Blastocatellia bacterium]